MIRSRQNPVLQGFRNIRAGGVTANVGFHASIWLMTYPEYRAFHIYSEADLDEAHKVLDRLERIYR